MIEIYTQADLDRVRMAGALEAPLQSLLQAKFRELRACMAENLDPAEAFTLVEIGHLIVLEPGDDLRGLERIGMNPCDGGLFGAVPEAVDKILLPGGSVFEIAILVTNETLRYLYARQGDFEGEFPEFAPYVRRWFARTYAFDPGRSELFEVAGPSVGPA